MPDDEVVLEVEHGGAMPCTFRVLADGRLQVAAYDRRWTLPLAESHEIAAAMLTAMRAE